MPCELINLDNSGWEKNTTLGYAAYKKPTLNKLTNRSKRIEKDISWQH